MLHILKTSRFHTTEVLAASFCNFRDTHLTSFLLQRTCYCAAVAQTSARFKINRIYIYILPHKLRQTLGLLYLLLVLSTKCYVCEHMPDQQLSHSTLLYHLLAYTYFCQTPLPRISYSIWSSDLACEVSDIAPFDFFMQGHSKDISHLQKLQTRENFCSKSWITLTAKLNYQKDDKFSFEMRRSVRGRLEVIFYNSQCNRIRN